MTFIFDREQNHEVQANSKVPSSITEFNGALRAPIKPRAARKGCPCIPESGRQLKTFKSREGKRWHSYGDKTENSSP